MLLEAAIGEAFANGFKYADERFVRKHLYSNYYVQNPKYRINLGHYIDQTQLALAEMILDKTKWTKNNIANKFVSVYKRDPRRGSRFCELLREVRDGKELIKMIRSDSEKNGAAMRSPVLGLLPLKRALVCAEKQASITHNTKIGIDSAKAVAVMSFFRKERKKITTQLNKHVPQNFDWNEPWDGPVSNNGLAAVRAALFSLLNHDGLTDILRACISYTGDVDVAASVALAVASGCPEIKQDLPPEMVEGFEDGSYGKDYLIGLDCKLNG